MRENSELRTIIQHAGLSLPHPSSSSLCSSSIPNGCETETEPVLDLKSPRSSVQRPASMYEPREGLLLRSGSQSPHIHHYVSATGNIGKWDKNQVWKYQSCKFICIHQVSGKIYYKLAEHSCSSFWSQLPCLTSISGVFLPFSGMINDFLFCYIVQTGTMIHLTSIQLLWRPLFLDVQAIRIWKLSPTSF